MMSEHAWFREQVETRLAGGLAQAEAERFQVHLKGCEACRELFDESASHAESMENLFAGIGPEPGLEDRVIQRLRTAPRANAAIPIWYRFAIGVAAAALLGVLGFILNESKTFEAGYANVGEARQRITAGTEVESATKRIDLASGWGHTSDPASMANDGANGILSIMGGARGALASAGTPGREVTFGDTGVTFTAAAPDADNKRFPKQPEAPADEEFEKARGGSLDHLADKPFHEAFKDMDRIGAGGGGGGKYGGRIGEKKAEEAELGENRRAGEDYYSYRNYGGERENAKPDASAAQTPGYFKPADLATKLKEAPPATKAPAPSDPKADPRAPSVTHSTQGGQDKPPAPPPQPEPPVQRKIIRNGKVVAEVNSFETSLEKVTRIASEEGGYISTVSSEKLSNGKVLGTVVLRIPPDRLDTVVRRLRDALEEIKSQELAAQDVTKQYFDLESRLRAARAMEERLLKIIKEGKGEVKDLLEVEKQIGVWREKIEEYEGEIKFYNNLVSLSTLTLILNERDIKTPTAASEQERVEMTLEVEDVQTTYDTAQTRITGLNGRIIQAELRVLEASQVYASIECEVAPDKTTDLIAQLKGLGPVGTMQRDRHQTVEGGVGRPEGIAVKRLDSRFKIAIYNLANIAPRRSTRANLACGNVEEAHKALVERVAKAKGRVLSSNVNRQKNDQSTGHLRFEVPAVEAEAVRDSLRLAGEVMGMSSTENPDTRNVTESKQGFEVTLYGLGTVAPRETVTLRLAAKSVGDAYRTLQLKVREWSGRILNAQLNETDRDNVTGVLDFDAPRERDAELGAQLTALGDVYSRSAARATESDQTIDSKLRYQIHLMNLDQVPARESAVLGIVVSDVEESFRKFAALVADKKGRVVTSDVNRLASGQVVGKFVCDLPLREFAGAVESFKSAGNVRVVRLGRNHQVPDSELAHGRIDMALSNGDIIVGSDEGVGSFFAKGLRWMLLSLSYFVTGLVVLLPWVLIAFGLYKLVAAARRRRSTANAS